MTLPGEHQSAPHSDREIRVQASDWTPEKMIDPGRPVPIVRREVGPGASIAAFLILFDVLWVGFTSTFPIVPRVLLGLLWLLFAAMCVIFDREVQARREDVRRAETVERLRAARRRRTRRGNGAQL